MISRQIVMGVKRYMKNNKCVAPGLILRSSLFGICKRGDRQYFTKKEIASYDNCVIKYTGQQLDQSDFDVWLEILRLTHKSIFEDCKTYSVSFDTKKFLISINKSYGGSSRKWLEDSLTRLKYHMLEIKYSSKYIGSFINTIIYNTTKSQISVDINTEIANLFITGFGVIELSERKLLKGSLTKWLHGFIRAQGGVYFSIGILKLQNILQSKMEYRLFKFNLKKSLTQLEEYKIIHGFKISSNDVLTITNKVSRVISKTLL